MDEFAWILIAALIFILIITVIWLPSRGPSPVVEPKSVEKLEEKPEEEPAKKPIPPKKK